MKVYCVYSKTFFKNESGYDQQVADLGETPMIFTDKYWAVKQLYETAQKEGIKNTEIQLFPFMHFEKIWENGENRYKTIWALQETETF